MGTNDENVKGFFTAYLNVALKHEQEDYIKRKAKVDIPVDMEKTGLERQVEFEQNYEEFILEKLKKIPDIRRTGWENVLKGYGAELEKAVSCLEEPERMVIYLKVYGELSYKEIGELMGMSDRKAASIKRSLMGSLMRTYSRNCVKSC